MSVYSLNLQKLPGCFTHDLETKLLVLASQCEDTREWEGNLSLIFLGGGTGEQRDGERHISFMDSPGCK